MITLTMGHAPELSGEDQNVWQTRQEMRMALLSTTTDEEDASHSYEGRFTPKRLRLNVGGTRFEVMSHSLRWLPETRLGKLVRCDSEEEVVRLCDDYEPEKKEYFFDRDPRVFSCVLGLYRARKLHISEELCSGHISEELLYWGIDVDLMESCCSMKFHQKKEQIDDANRKDSAVVDEQDVEDFGHKCYPVMRKRIWDTMEKPQTSRLAKVVSIISILAVLISTVTLTIGTIPEVMQNTTIIKNVTNPLQPNNATHEEVLECELHENEILEYIEMVCILWFTVEYLLRLYACPNKLQFLKAAMNIIDLLAIVPFYITKLIFLFHQNTDSNMESLNTFKKIMPIFRVLRIVRVLKLARHSVGLQSLGHTVSNSYEELGLLMMFVMLAMLIFSSLVYYAEKEENEEGFSSIPASFWWSIVTMTTVGYGDVVPKSIVGRFVGSMCSLCGVLVIALPIPIIVNNFADYYKQQTLRQKMLKRRANAMKVTAKTKDNEVKIVENGVVTEEEIHEKNSIWELKKCSESMEVVPLKHSASVVSHERHPVSCTPYRERQAV